MKDLLYLKDEQLKEFIEKLFIGYRESFGDAKKTLDKYSLGVAHHKVIHIISIHEGITISKLLKKLKVTKQSLNRVLRDLIKSKMIKQIKDESDTRKKNLFLDKEGCEMLYALTPHLQNATWIRADLEQICNSVAESFGVKFGKLASPIRSALSGQTKTPSVFDMMLVLGRKETIARLTNV